MDEPAVYLNKMAEALERLSATENYLSKLKDGGHPIELESAALQLRKSMEAIAFAAIAPNKEQYAAIRKNAEKSTDYRSDWQADTIFLTLRKVNPDFYPDPLIQRVQIEPGHWHYEKLLDGYMTRKNFETMYKRLGKFLHADNPWGSDKGWASLAKDLPDAIKKIRALLSIHRTIIRVVEFNGVWIVEAPSDGTPPRMIRATAQGEFIATRT
ncbi:hypothetical protein [Glaciimonas soli]|uniref:Uncharacterized protein n=1 Tax=Glaciimonas soli TaxID=2590999 RepID=A0A843YXJ3_9BURK|nr:hypothetical protein [Glaciimonas soli]MQR02473.1 hypothetical protein [Glaciimonas soli]